MSYFSIAGRVRKTKKKMMSDLVTERDFYLYLEQLKKCDPSETEYIKIQIVRLFDLIGIRCEPCREISYYERLIKETKLPQCSDASYKMLEVMKNYFTEFPSPTDFMKQTINRLCVGDGWEDDTLRLRILKHFIKDGNSLTYRVEKTENGKKKMKRVTIYQGAAYIKKWTKKKLGKSDVTDDEILAALDDSVFDVLGDTKRDRDSIELIRACDDIAEGKFRSSGVTKKTLYLLAMVLDMKYDLDEDIRDVESVLFFDYYSNNLMRFITDAYSGNLGAYELDPSGMGINYKNYAEVIYVYFIAKDLSPAEKIMRSNELIEELKDRSVSSSSDVVAEPSTVYCRTVFMDKIVKLPEDEFKEEIINDYDRRVFFSSLSQDGDPYIEVKSPIQINSSQKTAYKYYCSYIEKLEALGVKLKDCDYGIGFMMGADIDNGDEESAKFKKLLDGINRMLITKAFTVKKAENMTRTALITAFYYYYNASQISSRREKSLLDVYNNYTSGKESLNAVLDKVHYQPIDEKNIFDMAVIFSSYSYIYEEFNV